MHTFRVGQVYLGGTDDEYRFEVDRILPDGCAVGHYTAPPRICGSSDFWTTGMPSSLGWRLVDADPWAAQRAYAAEHGYRWIGAP